VDRVGGQGPTPQWAKGANNLGMRKSLTFRCTKTYDEVSMKRELVAAESRGDKAASVDLRLRLKTIKDLIYKRGFGKVSGQRIPLSDNQVVSAALGEFGMECVEDVIHEITTVGPHFKEASNFLWPFKLSSPKGGFRGKMLNHFNEGGACGQQQEKINILIKKML
jgi:hypothetical protein